jgi:hypothetical protein
MRGDVPPLPNTSSWRGAYLSTGDNFTFTFTFKSLGHIFIVVTGYLLIVKYSKATYSLSSIIY